MINCANLLAPVVDIMKKLIALLPVILAFACINSGCFSKPVNSPSINSFNSNPPVIDPGSNAMLSWDVTGAETISIDNGIGNVALTGSRIVTPTVTTVYTLTAKGQGISVTATTEVVISKTAAAPGTSTAPAPVPAPSTTPISMPDLAITDVSNSESIISYTITNQGDAPAGPSTTSLVIDGMLKANSSVGPLAPAASSILSFDYTYSCTDNQDIVSVQSDKNNIIDESNEDNNTYSVTWACMQQMTLSPFILKPDLIVAEIQKTDSGAWFNIIIYNKGPVRAAASEVKVFTVGGDDEASLPVPPVPAGEKIIVKFFTLEDEHYDRHPIGSSGKLTAIADINNQIDESDENNNSLTIDLFY
jgi:subtilase family serine protease